MTVGIYKISFKNTDKVYIGQSLNIETRWNSHLSELKNNKGSIKLQEAYRIYGIDKLQIILECDIAELDLAEKEAIEIYNSCENGFNSLPDARAPIMYGEQNPNALENNQKYIDVLKLLVQQNPTFSKKEISNITGVSIYIINHIAALESHTWLKEILPVEYKKLQNQKTIPFYRGTQYPKLISPEGIEYEVINITQFAKTHGLLQPKITEVMKGTRNHHKGWTAKAWWN